MAFQSAVTQNPVLGVPGTVSDTSPQDTVTVFAELGPSDPIQGILPGHLVVRGTDFRQALLPTALAADADAIIGAAGLSNTLAQDLTEINFDGVVGGSRWALPTLVDLVVAASADWLATNATITGYNETGALVSETLAISAGGANTSTTTNTYAQITRLEIPVQGGNTGTYTLGVAGAASAVLPKNIIHGIANNDEHREGFPDLNGIATSGLSEIPYPATAGFGAHRFNRVWVRTQDVVTSGAPAFVRIVNSAGPGLPSNCGQFRSDSDGGSAILVPGASYRYVEGTLAEVEVNFRA